MIVDCAYYLDGQRSDVGPMSMEEAAARAGQGGFVWLGLFEPDEAELAQVRHLFGLHELAVEDAQNFHMRPKIETYDKDVQLVILRTARYDDAAEEVEFGEISVFLSPTFVIAVRQGIASELREARLRLEQRPELLAAGSSSALWAIMDQVVDGYAPVVAGLEHDIDQIEATVFSGAVAPTERIYSLRNEATDFYRAVHPLLAVTAIVERAAHKKLRPYFRDVRDHLLLVDEEVTDQRDSLGHGAPGQHGGDLGRADQGQRPAELHHRAAHDPGHGLPPAHVRDRVLRPELRLAGPAHQRLRSVPRLRHRRPGGAAGAAVLVAEAALGPRRTAAAGRPAADRAACSGLGGACAKTVAAGLLLDAPVPDGGRLSNALAAESMEGLAMVRGRGFITAGGGRDPGGRAGRRRPGG